MKALNENTGCVALGFASQTQDRRWSRFTACRAVGLGEMETIGFVLSLAVACMWSGSAVPDQEGWEKRGQLGSFSRPAVACGRSMLAVAEKKGWEKWRQLGSSENSLRRLWRMDPSPPFSWGRVTLHVCHDCSFLSLAVACGWSVSAVARNKGATIWFERVGWMAAWCGLHHGDPFNACGNKTAGERPESATAPVGLESKSWTCFFPVADDHR